MTDEKYNGWTNRETWATALWIDNDPDMHEYRNCLCASAVHHKATREPRFTLSDELREWIAELAQEFYHDAANNPGLGNMFLDIGSLWRVNYDEIAANWLSDFDIEDVA
jgi:hypothetical protein